MSVHPKKQQEKQSPEQLPYQQAMSEEKMGNKPHVIAVSENARKRQINRLVTVALMNDVPLTDIIVMRGKKRWGISSYEIGFAHNREPAVTCTLVAL